MSKVTKVVLKRCCFYLKSYLEPVYQTLAMNSLFHTAHYTLLLLAGQPSVKDGDPLASVWSG